METLIVPGPVRAKLGHEASEGLVEMFTLHNQIASERLERRLAEMTSALRLELHEGLAGVRHEMADMRVEWLKWSFVFWIGHVGITLGVVAYMLGGTAR